jgi:hypothetical protein
MEIAYELNYIDEKEYKQFTQTAKNLSVKMSNFIARIK